MVVQSHLAAGDDAGISEPVAKPLRDGGTPGRGIVRVDTGGGREALLGGGEGEGAVGGLGRLTDHDDVDQTRPPRPLENLRPVGLVGEVSEMAVGVDQHGVDAWDRCHGIIALIGCHPERSEGSRAPLPDTHLLDPSLRSG
jgi:hypothetical protein